MRLGLFDVREGRPICAMIYYNKLHFCYFDQLYCAVDKPLQKYR